MDLLDLDQGPTIQRARASICFWPALIVAFYLGGNVAPAQPIVQRDLSIIRDQHITDFDDHRIQLSGGGILQWDEVLKATVSPQRQDEFDRKLATIGLPLFRLKQRLERGDWSGLSGIAEGMYRDLEFDGLVAATPSVKSYLVCVATMKSRIHDHRRAHAVLPFLRAVTIQSGWQATGEELPSMFSEEEIALMLADDLAPVWFDIERVEPAFQQLAGSFVPQNHIDRPGAIIYLASMAIQIRRLQFAEELLQQLPEHDPRVNSWKRILACQLEIQRGDRLLATRRLSTELDQLVESATPVAWYLIASPQFVNPRTADLPIRHNADGTVDPDVRAEPPEFEVNAKADAMLYLTRIVAAGGSVHPAITSAALYQSAQIARSLNWAYEADVYRRELMVQFPGSYHAKLLESEVALDDSGFWK